MRRVTLADGATIAFHDEGRGPLVLLLHGFTGTARAHMGLLMDDLARDHRVIAPDLRGYGASRPPERDFPADFYQRDAADMAALLDMLAAGPALAVGFSDGAESALLLAAARPDLVRGAVGWGVAGVMPAAHLAAVQEWLPVSAWAERRPVWRQEIIDLQGADRLEPLVIGWVRAAEAIAAAGGNICLAEAPQIRCPTLLINGDGEVGNPPEDARRLADAIPDCRLVFVADSGHSIQDDQPATLLRLIREFLAGLG